MNPTPMPRIRRLMCLAVMLAPAGAADLPYTVVDTGQDRCYDERGETAPPAAGQPFFGQDAQYQGPAAAYEVSGDGLTAKDLRTGLIWQRSPESNGDGRLTYADKLTWEQALQRPAALNAAKFGGFDDWRLPSIKELYSLFDARGTDPGPGDSEGGGLRPFIDAKAFPFIYGDTTQGARIIDSQYGSATRYVGRPPRGGHKVFGVNFADGRIKGYDQSMPGGNRSFRFFILCVRGNPRYGINDFRDNGDGTVLDRATGLVWSREDSGKAMDWKQALAWVAGMNARRHLGFDDWRLPDVKELQSLVDYTRSPDTSNSAAIDPVFACSPIRNEAGQADFPFYWSSTTHVGHRGGAAAMYVCFGRAGGFLPESMPAGGAPSRGRRSQQDDPVRWVDVHGAGAQRSDPKTGDPGDFPRGRGPQGDVVRILNHVRLVRGGDVKRVEVVSAAAGNGGDRPPDEAAGSEGRPGGGFPNGSGSGGPPREGGPNPPVVAALDANADGVIDKAEIAGAAAALLKLDANRDGKLDAAEFRPRFPAEPPGGDREGFRGGPAGTNPPRGGGAGRVPIHGPQFGP